MRTEIGLNAFAVCIHCIFAFFPISWTNFTFFLDVSESIDDAQIFRDIPSDWHVIDSLMKNHALFVDEKVAR